MNIHKNPKTIAGMIATFVFASALVANASWNDPATTPPGCPSGHSGCDAPINVGSSTQTKSGVINVYGLHSYVDINVDEDVHIDGEAHAKAFFYSSDKTLKKNIAPLASSLSNILKLQGVSFNWKKDGKASVGLIAQDVEKVYPELVSTDAATGLKSVEYGNLVAPLIEAVKAQQKEIESLKKEVEVLKSKLSN